MIALALLTGACAAPPAGSAAIDWAQAQTITVAMVDYRFVPDQLRLRRGLAYRLRLENRGTALHEFTAPAFLSAVDLRDPAVLAAGKNEVVVPPGGRKDVYFVARQPGRYAPTCADHDWAGMTGTITIE